MFIFYLYYKWARFEKGVGVGDFERDIKSVTKSDFATIFESKEGFLVIVMIMVKLLILKLIIF